METVARLAANAVVYSGFLAKPGHVYRAGYRVETKIGWV